MKKYRIVQDNYSGYEAQVKYPWFPFAWFQASDFYWVNTWETPEQAKLFIQKKKSGTYSSESFRELGAKNEFEREAKLLLFQARSSSPKVIWEDETDQLQVPEKKKWRLALSSFF